MEGAFRSGRVDLISDAFFQAAFSVPVPLLTIDLAARSSQPMMCVLPEATAADVKSVFPLGLGTRI
jgi:hypothetical protein